MLHKHQGATLPPRWWETVSALARPYLKAQGKTLVGLIERLDELHGRGFDAIEIFAPCQGGVCYNGLDTIDFYQIDPANGCEKPISGEENTCDIVI
jgi:glycosidase